MRITSLPNSAPAPRRAFGIASLDAALSGGLAYGCIHEVYAADGDDMSAAAAFVLAMASGMAPPDRSILWLRSRRTTGLTVQASGWAELGGAPQQGLLAVVPDSKTLLRAAVDALRCPALGAVIAEDWGRMRELDLTASRRLVLAAERSGVPLFLLRADAEPSPSAAQTRWQVASAASQALPGNAPGAPCFDIDLLRQKSGPCGLSWRLEWNRDQCQFRDTALSGAVVPLPAQQPAAAGTSAPLHQYAA
jgi:protein ImuA